jgi:carotenoid cleavage dioxygenase-like enzyme
MDRLRAGKPVTPGRLERFRISPQARSVRSEWLIEHPFELPRINYGQVNERPYRYAWGIGIVGGWIDRIVKADVEQRTSTVWSEDGCFPGEPVFVPTPNATAEEQGVLLSIVFDGRKGNSYLLVLDAGSLAELARAEVPHHIPYGFHGQFAAAG